MTVYDASALLAYLQNEAGADAVRSRLLEGGYCSAANWSEVAQKVSARGGRWADARLLLSRYNLTIERVDAVDAEAAAALWMKGEGLSLADRLCLALGTRLDAEILTTDADWAGRQGVVVIR